MRGPILHTADTTPSNLTLSGVSRFKPIDEVVLSIEKLKARLEILANKPQQEQSITEEDKTALLAEIDALFLELILLEESGTNTLKQKKRLLQLSHDIEIRYESQFINSTTNILYNKEISDTEINAKTNELWIKYYYSLSCPNRKHKKGMYVTGRLLANAETHYLGYFIFGVSPALAYVSLFALVLISIPILLGVYLTQRELYVPAVYQFLQLCQRNHEGNRRLWRDKQGNKLTTAGWIGILFSLSISALSSAMFGLSFFAGIFILTSLIASPWITLPILVVAGVIAVIFTVATTALFFNGMRSKLLDFLASDKSYKAFCNKKIREYRIKNNAFNLTDEEVLGELSLTKLSYYKDYAYSLIALAASLTLVYTLYAAGIAVTEDFEKTFRLPIMLGISIALAVCYAIPLGFFYFMAAYERFCNWVTHKTSNNSLEQKGDFPVARWKARLASASNTLANIFLPLLLLLQGSLSLKGSVLLLGTVVMAKGTFVANEIPYFNAIKKKKALDAFLEENMDDNNPKGYVESAYKLKRLLSVIKDDPVKKTRIVMEEMNCIYNEMQDIIYSSCEEKIDFPEMQQNYMDALYKQLQDFLPELNFETEGAVAIYISIRTQEELQKLKNKENSRAIDFVLKRFRDHAIPGTSESNNLRKDILDNLLVKSDSNDITHFTEQDIKSLKLIHPVLDPFTKYLKGRKICSFWQSSCLRHNKKSAEELRNKLADILFPERKKSISPEEEPKTAYQTLEDEFLSLVDSQDDQGHKINLSGSYFRAVYQALKVTCAIDGSDDAKERFQDIEEALKTHRLSSKEFRNFCLEMREDSTAASAKVSDGYSSDEQKVPLLGQ